MKTFNEGFHALAITVEHHFADGVYAKETRIPAGRELRQHAHPYAHLSVLASGVVSLQEGDSPPRLLKAPACVSIAAGVEHCVRSRTEAVWFCVHASQCTDPELIDAQLT